ncbi:MAG: hypothetical protein JW891_17360 [Candidatus Lokiarchaeota archaeon]|nr:hypothetical protein [Candidatus Lokiarchaeota archaeon]
MCDENEDLIHEINVAAYFLSEEGHPYDTLCWFLAERQLQMEKLGAYIPEENIKQKAAQIYFEQCPYDILVWRVAELDILYQRVYGYDDNDE